MVGKLIRIWFLIVTLVFLTVRIEIVLTTIIMIFIPNLLVGFLYSGKKSS